MLRIRNTKHTTDERDPDLPHVVNKSAESVFYTLASAEPHSHVECPQITTSHVNVGSIGRLAEVIESVAYVRHDCLHTQSLGATTYYNPLLIIPIPKQSRHRRPPRPPPPRFLRLPIIPPIMPELSRNARAHRSAAQTRLARTPPIISTDLVRALDAIVPAVNSRSPQPMVPAVPTSSSDNRRRRVPAGVADDRLPRAGAAVVVVAVGVALVGRGAGVHGGGLHVYLRARGAVEVPDVHAAVVGAGVDVSLVGGGCGGEVAADEGLEDTVAAEGHEGAVVRVGGVVEDVVGGEAVVEVCGVVLLMIVSTGSAWRSCKTLTCGFTPSPTSVETIFRKSQSLHV